MLHFLFLDDNCSPIGSSTVAPRGSGDDPPPLGCGRGAEGLGRAAGLLRVASDDSVCRGREWGREWGRVLVWLCASVVQTPLLTIITSTERRWMVVRTTQLVDMHAFVDSFYC